MSGNIVVNQMKHPFVLSHFQTKSLLQAQKNGKHCFNVSTDLGLTMVDVIIKTAGVQFPNGLLLTWNIIETINKSTNNCFIIKEGKPQKIQFFSENLNRHYSLMPTNKAPTMLISGTLMHRIKGTDPFQDTLEKIKVLKPMVGCVLDTATGLGYTAIEAAKTADQVITIELDPAVLEISRLNPWSKQLFNNPNITKYIGNSYNIIEEFDKSTFTRIIHDPPVFSLAGQLYSSEFYDRLYHLLQNRGRLFHYIGNPKSKSGYKITRGVINRLKKVGFSQIIKQPHAFGILAFK